MVSKVNPNSLLHGRGGDLEHPGGRIEALSAARNARYRLEVLDERPRSLAQGAMIGDLASDFHEQQIIECLQMRHSHEDAGLATTSPLIDLEQSLATKPQGKFPHAISERPFGTSVDKSMILNAELICSALRLGLEQSALTEA